MATIISQPQTAPSPETIGSLNLNTAADAVQTSTFILLHGFFFMEFQKDQQGDMLVAASPAFDHHQFLSRDHDGVFHNLRGLSPIDLRTVLKPGTINSFDSQQILRFSRSELGLGSFLIDTSDVGSFGILLKLPLPKQIRPLRLGDFANFHPLQTGKVAQSIKRLQGFEENTAVIVCLEYEVAQGAQFTRSFYAAHQGMPMDPDVAITEVNDTLDAATSVFGQVFDLQVTQVDVNVIVDIDDAKLLPPGIVPDDEVQLEERRDMSMSLLGHSVSPSTCPKLGVVA